MTEYRHLNWDVMYGFSFHKNELATSVKRKRNLMEMNRIKEVLEEKGIKQTWLSEQLGKSYNMVNSYVQNRQQPRLEVIFEIADILEVKTKRLIKR